MRKERDLLTGANSGFIGRHLAANLEGQCHNVLKLPRRVLSEPSSNVVEFQPDRIFHLAAYGNHHTQIDIKEIYKANVLNLLALLQATRNLPYIAFVNVGSSSEYGRSANPMRENDSPNPDTFYAASKAAGTFLAKVWAKQFDKPIVTIRPFSVFGPGEADTRFIPTAIRCALTNKELTLAPGVHDWIYIDDLINGMLLVAKNANELKGQVVNIGTGMQFANAEVVKVIERVLDRQIITKHTGSIRSYDTTKSWVADNSKLTSLGWQQQVALEEGIRRTAEYYGSRIIT